MGFSVERFDQRPWPDDDLEALFAEGFPAFITADSEARRYVGRVREHFAHLDIVLVAENLPVAAGWGVPVRWDGTLEDLPTGYTATIRRAVDGHEAGSGSDTFVICAGITRPDRKGSGVAEALVGALVDLAAAHDLDRVIAPLRPTLKHRYPLTDIAEYASWMRSDGTSFDPWLRLHVRLGASVLTTAPASQTMTGTVTEWEGWAGMAFPASGRYVIPDGLAPLDVDREADLGTYVEPNIWVRHR